MLADSHGNVIHLGERDCSIQRRHQKVIEEAPGPHVDDEMRERIGKIATDAAAAVGYRGAGTVEGMQVGDEYFFLEMNTRVQVEHCVTEMVTGDRHRPRADPGRRRRAALDLPGGRRAARPRDRVPDQRRGGAQEIRPGAGRDHAPTASRPGPASASTPASRRGSEVTPMYDPMVAKLIVWDVDREKATRRMLRALGEYEVGGLTTLIPFHEAILATEQWANGETCRDLMEDRDWLKSTAPGGGRRRRRTPRTRRADGRARLQGRGLRQALRRQGDRRGGGRDRAGAAAAASGRPNASASRAAARAPRARRCPRRCRARSSKSPSRRAPRSPRAT